jgi:hypothetical protein
MRTLSKEIIDAGFKDAEDGLAQITPIEERGFLKDLGSIHESDLFPKEWKPEEIVKASNELFDRRFTSRFWSKIPKICSEACNFSKDGECALSKKPVGSQCPEELAFLGLLMRRYMEDLNVTTSDMASLSMIRDLCDVEIQLMRKAGIMAREDVIQEEPILDGKGVPTDYTRLVEHPIAGHQERLWKRKGEILKQLVATREAKFKVIGDLVKDDEMARGARALKEMRRQIALGNVLDGNYHEEFKDDFVDVDPTE